MANVLVNSDAMTAIANAIRTKNETQDTYKPEQMAAAILAIETGIDTSDATATAGDILSGKTAYADGEKLTGTIPTKGQSDLAVSGPTVTVPAGYYAAQVNKNVAAAVHPKPTAAIDSRTGVVTATHTQGSGYVTGGTTAETLNLATQAGGTITPSQSEQTAVAAGTFVTGDVKVAAMTTVEQATPVVSIDANALVTATAEQDAGYVESGSKSGTLQLTKRTSDDLTASGATVTAPAGYYPEAASKAVATATQATPGIIVSVAGVVTASATQAAGYVSAGSKIATHTLASTDDAEFVASNIVNGVTIFGLKGTRVPLDSAASKAAETYNTATSDRTIASGTYLTGAQTIKAVQTSNISAANIKSGVTVKVGDANSAGRIANVAGTFTASNTVSSGQTAAASAQILSGYSAWVNGAEVKGSVAVYDGSVEVVS